MNIYVKKYKAGADGKCQAKMLKKYLHIILRVFLFHF